MSFADAVVREAAWFTADLSAAGLPPLTLALGGPFDIVQAYVRSVSRRARELYLWRSAAVEHRVSLGGRKDIEHQMVATILWPVTSGRGSAESDQAALDAAVEAVMARVRGLLGDKSHGGRFVSAGEMTGSYGGPSISVASVGDPFAAVAGTEPMRVDVRWIAVEQFVA